jgi:hypothetical protein
MRTKIPTAGENNGVGSTSPELRESEARRHIDAIAGKHRAARGRIDQVSMPGPRKLGRRLVLIWVRVEEFVGGILRRLGDSHKIPGRWFSRLRLYRPFQTLTPLVLFWLVLGGVFAVGKFELFAANFPEPLNWLSDWGFPLAVAALAATIWIDGLKSPFVVWRIRRRIVEDPTALLRLTLAQQTTKVVELEPPLETVPRDELYDELLPGVLPRTKDIQIIVGDPGAGKTTALLDLASILAKIGFVPVLLQLRGAGSGGDLFELARHQFETQARPLVRVAAELDIVWRWLCRRQRLVFLVDDLDQIGFDGEAGFHMRRLLEDLAPEGQAVIVTARPSGVPVGIAASAIEMEPLALETAVDIVAAPRQREAGAISGTRPSHRRIVSWVAGGELMEAPLYLEALAEMSAVGVCPDLPEDPRQWEKSQRPGRWREHSKQRCEWNPLWVRYRLLDRFRERIVDGNVRRTLAIDRHERERCVHALEGAALGVLGATGVDAKAAAQRPDEPEETRQGRARRRSLVDFIDTDDRRDFDPQHVDCRIVNRRSDISRHEAVDTGERLRILDRDQNGEAQFRHRIMQAYFAGRQLAEIGREQGVGTGGKHAVRNGKDGHILSFDDWVKALISPCHPERLTAHLTLTFAAIYADDRLGAGKQGTEVAWRIVEKLVKSVEAAPSATAGGKRSRNGRPRQNGKLDPMTAPDPYERDDPDDNLIKLTTAANIVTLLKPKKGSERSRDFSSRILRALRLSTRGAMRWTKQKALPAIAALDDKKSWEAVWTWFARDTDYEVRRSASRQLERNAWSAFSKLEAGIKESILKASRRAASGQPLSGRDKDWNAESIMTFEALGWVLPAIVSGLNEEMDDHPGAETEESLKQARMRLGELVALAFEGGRPKLEDSLAQGFKADAMRHAAAPGKEFTGAGWVVGNRRLVADVALPHAESWYARMLLYQALALYAVAGTDREDTLDVLANRLKPTRERHPLARRAAKLARAGLRRAQVGSDRWMAYIWSDDVEGAGGLPTALGHSASQLVSDVTILVDLKEGSAVAHHEKFGHMEELPHCLSESRDRHEILGAGCPSHCGWEFCPYRAAAPDEPNQHRGISRGFCRAQRRVSIWQRPPAWQRSIGRRRVRDFWRQMEYKARR